MTQTASKQIRWLSMPWRNRVSRHAKFLILALKERLTSCRSCELGVLITAFSPLNPLSPITFLPAGGILAMSTAGRWLYHGQMPCRVHSSTQGNYREPRSQARCLDQLIQTCASNTWGSLRELGGGVHSHHNVGHRPWLWISRCLHHWAMDGHVPNALAK